MPETVINSDVILASRGKRLLANIVDEIIIIIMLKTAYHFYLQYNPDFESNISNSIAVFLYYWALIFVFNFYFLRNGQTIGKKIVGLQMVDVRGRPNSVFRIFFIRYFMFNLILMVLCMCIGIGVFVYSEHHGDTYFNLTNINSSNILYLLMTIDVLFIFGKKRRCLHDMIARTKVIDIREEVNNESKPSV